MITRQNILFVAGMSPQVVTETLYGLWQRGDLNIPTQIRILTTSDGARRALLQLLHPDQGHFHHFCRDYSVTNVTLREQDIEPLRRADDTVLTDIRSAEDNEAAANGILAAVKELTEARECRLHASIAGGRKTMGYYLGYAMSLLGRPGDVLSHVLVDADYEGNRDFFYPTPSSHVIYHPVTQAPLDSQNAGVSLALIPFIRLRGELSNHSIAREASFSDTVSRLQSYLDTPALEIDLSARIARIANHEIAFPPAQLAFYCWLAQRRIDGKEAVSCPVEGEFVEEWREPLLDLYRLIVGPAGDTSSIERALQQGVDKSYFEEKRSRVNTLLKEKLGAELAEIYSIKRSGKRGHSRYAVELKSTNIEIKQL